VAREVVLPTVRPRVMVYWMTEPDQSQHLFGVGSPQARAALRGADRDLGLFLDALGARRDSTDLIIVSDHGFAHGAEQVNVAQALGVAGLNGDVVVGDDGQVANFWVKGHDARRVGAIARWAQRQPWADVVLTRGGAVPGTVSLDVVHLAHPVRAPDVVVTLRWSADTNAYGVSGSVAVVTTGPVVSGGDTHGGLNPYTVRNTMIAWGPDFGRGVVDSMPVGNVDVAPTVLALLGVRVAPGEMDGRVLGEALRGGVEGLVVRDTVAVRDGAYGARVARQRVGDHWYVDGGWRVR
jgi:arylsulfatase A-like enzyme